MHVRQRHESQILIGCPSDAYVQDSRGVSGRIVFRARSLAQQKGAQQSVQLIGGYAILKGRSSKPANR